MTVFIHAGRSKTATSYLQTVMASNSDALSREGLIYPQLGSSVGIARSGLPTAGNAIYLALLLTNKDRLPSTITEAQILDDLDKVCKKNPKKNVILSSELFEVLTVDGMRQLSQIFKSIGRNVHFIQYIRGPVGAFESIYAQGVKRHGDIKSPEEYVFSLKLWAVKYFKYFDNLTECDIPFTIKKYDKKAYKGGRIELDFFSTLGVEYSEKDLIYPENIVNPTPSKFGLRVLRECNLLGEGLPYYDRNTAAVCKVDKVLGLTSGVFEPYLKKYISEHTKTNMDVLYERYSIGPFLEELRTSPKVPPVDYETYRFLFLRALSEMFSKI